MLLDLTSLGFELKTSNTRGARINYRGDTKWIQ